MYLVRVFLFVLFVLAVSVEAGVAQKPGDIILYTGNSLGQFQACPTCGRYAEGGLDRRATVFAQSRAEGQTVFTLSGGYDFTSYMKRWKPKNGQMQALVDAYAALEYDFGALSVGDQKIFRHAEVKAPVGFAPVADVPEVRIIDKGAVRLGVLLLPVAKENEFVPGQEQFQRAADVARALRAQSDIVVAISTWGGRGEVAFMDAFPGVVDVLLGGGPGPGAGARIENDGATLWVRPKPDGRAVMRLGLTSFLDAGKWSEGDLQFDSLSLDIHIKGDGRISALFSWI